MCCIVCHQQQQQKTPATTEIILNTKNWPNYFLFSDPWHSIFEFTYCDSDQNFILIFLSFIVINKMAFITNQLKISAQALWLKFYSFSMKPRFNQDFNVFHP